MVDLERGLALRVEVSVALHLVEFTDNHLPQNPKVSTRYVVGEMIKRERTSWIEPGSFTVVSWLSLYRSKAGASEGRISSPSDVRACTSTLGHEA